MAVFKQGLPFGLCTILLFLWVSTLFSGTLAKWQNKEGSSSCKPNFTTCDCGPKSNGNKMAIFLKMCLVKNQTTGQKHCAPCHEVKRTLHPCLMYKHCKKCSSGLKGCATCPDDRRGKFCEEEIYLEVNGAVFDRRFRFWDDSMFSHSVPLDYYPHWMSDSENHQIQKRHSTCKLPQQTKYMEMQCMAYEKSYFCHQRCYWGHTFSEGVTKESTCKFAEDKWDEDVNEPCKPFVNCEIIKLNERAQLDCDDFKLYEPVKCRITCPDSKEIHESTCTIDSKWHPALPICVANAPKKRKASIPNCVPS